METKDTGCCPRFDEKPWNEKEFHWENKLFIKDRVKSIFHIPINFSQVVKRNMDMIEKAKATNPEYMMISDENSLWGADLYIATDKVIPGGVMEKLSGNFISKSYEGAYSNAGKWAKDFLKFLKSKSKSASKIFFWYTTCPKCAKAYGRNPVVLIGRA